MLEIKNLKASIKDREILKGLKEGTIEPIYKNNTDEE